MCQIQEPKSPFYRNINENKKGNLKSETWVVSFIDYTTQLIQNEKKRYFFIKPNFYFIKCLHWLVTPVNNTIEHLIESSSFSSCCCSSYCSSPSSSSWAEAQPSAAAAAVAAPTNYLNWTPVYSIFHILYRFSVRSWRHFLGKQSSWTLQQLVVCVCVCVYVCVRGGTLDILSMSFIEKRLWTFGVVNVFEQQKTWLRWVTNKQYSLMSNLMPTR